MSTHSRLSIANNLTIAGDGGEIEGLPGEDAHAFAIIESPSDKTLTIVGGGIPREESLLLRGSFDVRVRLANRAYVIADKKDPLILSTLPKLKHGPDAFFIAEAENGDEVGRLLVNVEVSGAGTWLLADHPSCKIVFNAPCTKLFGNFQVEKGTLEINQNFATRGNLYFRSVDDSTPAIQVAEGVIADFSQ